MTAFWTGFEKQAEVGGHFMRAEKQWGVPKKGSIKTGGAMRADRLLRAASQKRAPLSAAHTAVRNLSLKNQMRGLEAAETAVKKAKGL